MRRLFPLGLLLAIGAQACQRDGTTAPRGPQLSPQAEHATLQKIAFVSTRDGRARIYVMAADGSGQTRLSSGAGFFTEATPAWSSDGGRIVYESDAVDCECLHAVAPDGSQATQLTDHNGDIGDVEPNWSPDGATLAFTRIFFDNYEIMRIGADGRGETRLTNTGHDVNSTHPRWSPDGQRIAFTRFLPCLQGCTDGNKTEIFIINPDGSGETRLTFTGLNQDLDWSPDGGRLAFMSTRDGKAQIYVMNADGSAQTRLTNNSATDESPRWSPDGQHIALTSTRDGNAEIYVMNADGSGQTRLTTSPGSDAEPSWSSDGSQIAFTSHRDGHAQIYVMNADGSGQTALTSGAGDNSDPVWAPVRYRPSSAPAHVAFRVAPAAVITAGAVIAPAVRVSVADASWSAVPGGVARLELEGGSDGATLSGTTQVKLVDGVATFDDLRIDQPGHGYRLRATVGSVSAVSNEFSVAGPPAQLAFVAQPPATVREGATISPPIKIAVQDALGTTVPGTTQAVSLALGSNSSGATLSGTTTVQAVNGVATFTDLRVAPPGSGYILVASAAALAGATSTAFDVPLSFAGVTAGTNTCALSVGGTAYCWGQGGDNGDGTTTFRRTPVPVAGGLRFSMLALGTKMCGLTTGGSVYCWGWPVLTPQPVASGFTFTTITNYGCGRTADGVRYCWQDGSSPQPLDTEGHAFTVLSVGNFGMCGVTSNAAGYCRGINSAGQLGDGTRATPQAPPYWAAVTGGLSFTTLSSGSYNNTCGVTTTSGAAYCWGYDFGPTPALQSSGVAFTAVSSGWTHACGVATSGAGYCWGENTYGELGRGGGDTPLSPDGSVVGGLTWQVISAGSSHTCGVTTDGALYCWGATTTGPTRVPVQVVP